jgi:Mg-chelatase subunit ChlD
MTSDGEAGDERAGRARLKRVLDSLGTTYTDQEVEIQFGDTVGLDEDSGYSYRSDVDPSTPTFVLPADVSAYLDADLDRNAEYEILLDTLNHLSICERTDSWDRTERFVRSTDGSESLAAFVHRMVEHAFVTATRLSEYRGLAGAYSQRMTTLFGGDESVSELSQDAALVAGLRQLAYTGRVNGIDTAPDGVRGPLSYAAAELARVREPGVDPEERDEVAGRILEAVTDRLYRPRTAERHLDEHMELPFQEFGTVLPDREGPKVDDQSRATEADDSLSPLGLLVLLPFLPIIYLGYEDTLKTFFTPFPDGPYDLGIVCYPLFLPVFLLWALTRGVTRRLGVWEQFVDAGEWTYAVVTDTVGYVSGAIGAGRDGVSAARERLGDAINRRLPGERTLSFDQLYSAYTIPAVFPYILIDERFGDDELFDSFFWWLPAVEDGVAEKLFLLGAPVLLVLLFPVFLLWLLARVLGLWSWFVTEARSLRDWLARVARQWRRRLDPKRLLRRLRSALERLRSRLAYAARRGVRRLRGDDWRSSLPEDVEADRVERHLQTAMEGAEGGRIDEGDADEANDAARGDERSSQEFVESAPDEPALDEGDLSERLLAGSTELTAESPGEVSVVSVADEDADGSVLDDALRDLSRLERCTTGELRTRRAERDERMNGRDGSEAVFEAMRERGLDETIHELFARFPPEERRERRARTGHAVDTRAVAETAGGRLGQGDGLFRRRHHTETGTRCIGVAIDLSGSMDEFEAKVALAALASATAMLDDVVVATGFHGSERNVPLVTGPNEPFEPAHLSSIESGGSTPLASGVREARRVLKASTANERNLLVITDGSPNVPLDEGGDASADAKAEIEHCRRDDIAVVGIGLGTKYGMADLFGEDGYVVVNDNGFADRLLEVYRNQILQTNRY